MNSFALDRTTEKLPICGTPAAFMGRDLFGWDRILWCGHTPPRLAKGEQRWILMLRKLGFQLHRARPRGANGSKAQHLSPTPFDLQPSETRQLFPICVLVLALLSNCKLKQS